MTIDQIFVSSDCVVQSIKTELRRRKTHKALFKDPTICDLIIH